MCSDCRERLRQAQRMETVGRLAAGAVHDLKNLLQLIAGSADLVADGLTPADTRYQFVQQIVHSSDRAAGLVQQLLSWGHVEPARVSPASLNDVLSAMLPTLQWCTGKGVALTIVPDENLWPVLVDEDRFRQMVINLVLNARDAMPEGGGTIRIETFNRAAIDVAEALTASARTEWVEVRVVDTGTGMDEETIRRACDPFFTTRATEGGSGLGLATVADFVSDSAGSLSLRSRPGVGTTVVIRLPRATAWSPAVVPRARERVA